MRRCSVEVAPFSECIWLVCVVPGCIHAQEGEGGGALTCLCCIDQLVMACAHTLLKCVRGAVCPFHSRSTELSGSKLCLT